MSEDRIYTFYDDPESPSDHEDKINHPNHYAKSCSLECIDVMCLLWDNDEMADYCMINAFKYIWRYKHKNGLEDLRKAEWYLDKAHEICPTSYRADRAIDLRRILKEAFKDYGVNYEG